jgi:molybdopterin-binding protein
MRLSTRNQLPATVTDVQVGGVMAVVKVTLEGSSHEVIASVTKDAVEDLGIRSGSKVTVLVKATEVMLATE